MMVMLSNSGGSLGFLHSVITDFVGITNPTTLRFVDFRWV